MRNRFLDAFPWYRVICPIALLSGPRSPNAQEQTQMIASAIGKPAAKAPTIIKVNAESRFTSVRGLPVDISAFPTAEIKKPPLGCGRSLLSNQLLDTRASATSARCHCSLARPEVGRLTPR
jgi:hypothetical protein